MGKKRSVNTFSSVSKKILQGYGRGEGMDYKPWLSGHEFASQGMYIRMLGRTVPRIYRFMSRLEADSFTIYDCMPDVQDILEQYYLTLDETLEIASLLHVRHPFSGRYYNPMTTDLLIRKNNEWLARAVKTTRELENHRTLEKLEIERLYFKRRGIDWKIITEKQLNRHLIQNLTWLWYGQSPESAFPDTDRQLLLDAESVFQKLYDKNTLPFPAIIDRIESLYTAPPGFGICLFRSLIQKGIIKLDLSKPINMANPRRPLERNVPDERYHSYC